MWVTRRHVEGFADLEAPGATLNRRAWSQLGEEPVDLVNSISSRGGGE